MKGVKIINKNGTVNTIDPDFFVNEQSRSAANLTTPSRSYNNNKLCCVIYDACVRRS